MAGPSRMEDAVQEPEASKAPCSRRLVRLHASHRCRQIAMATTLHRADIGDGAVPDRARFEQTNGKHCCRGDQNGGGYRREMGGAVHSHEHSTTTVSAKSSPSPSPPLWVTSRRRQVRSPQSWGLAV